MTHFINTHICPHADAYTAAIIALGVGFSLGCFI